MSASAHLPAQLLGSGKSSGLSPLHTPVVCQANAGDHAAIHDLLVAVFQGPSRENYLATQDDPLYEPNDRLVVRRGTRLIAHGHLTKREMLYETEHVPVAGLSWLATLPEFRSQGHATSLLEAAHRQMQADRASMGVLHTRIPHFFRAQGWAVCGRHSHSVAGTRDVLAELSRLRPRVRSKPLVIRPWRQVELPAVMKIYQANTAGRVGPWYRSEDYWRWLITRNSSDQLWVAINGPDRFELECDKSPIVGYAITRDDEMLELMVDPAHPAARLALLGRACGEAIERDYHAIKVHAPPEDSVHVVCRAAGGTHLHHESDQGLVFMTRLFEPLRFLRFIRPVLRQRALRSELPLPAELGLNVEGDKYRISVTRRGAKVTQDSKTGRSYLSLNDADFTRLLMGHLQLEEAIAAERVECSTRVALETAQALFPALPLWRSPLDDGVAS